jgi:hypothetical protein
MSSTVTIGGGSTGCVLSMGASGASTNGTSASVTAVSEIVSINPSINWNEVDVTHLGSGVRRDFIQGLMDYTVDVSGNYLPDKIDLSAVPVQTTATGGGTKTFKITFNETTTATSQAVIIFEGFVTRFNPSISGPDEKISFDMTIRGTTAITTAGFASS